MVFVCAGRDLNVHIQFFLLRVVKFVDTTYFIRSCFIVVWMLHWDILQRCNTTGITFQLCFCAVFTHTLCFFGEGRKASCDLFSSTIAQASVMLRNFARNRFNCFLAVYTGLSRYSRGLESRFFGFDNCVSTSSLNAPGQKAGASIDVNRNTIGFRSPLLHARVLVKVSFLTKRWSPVHSLPRLPPSTARPSRRPVNLAPHSYIPCYTPV